MTFKEVLNKVDFVAQEKAILNFWDEDKSLEKLRALRAGGPTWSFIDGPITANNPMGVHHGWGRTYKDLYNRYYAMKGHELRYQQGFDCQGLWVEVEVEKELEFTSKKDIEAYGLEKFILRCKERVLRFAAVQTGQSKRLGYWMEWNDPEKLAWLGEQLLQDAQKVIEYEAPAGGVEGTAEQVVGRLGMPEVGGSYFTFSDENNYMIWAFLKKTWEKGWLYKGADSMPWCPRCATGISQHEIVTDGYAELTHQSVTLRFPLRGREGESLLVWTTTPWTLTSNVAAAVGPELDYDKVRQGDEILYLSKGTLGTLVGEHEVLETLKGKDMEGWTYDGPFDDLPAAQMQGGRTELKELIEDIEQSAVEAHRVILWDEVGEDEGTGIVHIAPGCGAEDYHLGREYGLPIIVPIDEEGVIVEGFDWLTGMGVAEVPEPIFENLKGKGLLYNVTAYTHRYPTCWRCKTELVWRVVDEWFINMGQTYDKPREALTQAEKDASLRYQIMDVTDQVRWVPEFGHAREMDWLRNMHDWMISKKRYWGLALPIWVCEDCEAHEVMGSEVELKARAVAGWDEFQGHTPHRPYVDAVKLACQACEGKMSRIPDVGNPWLDAGIVAFSTLRYRQDPDYWKKWYPADWISESFPGQFRNWFYSLLAMSTVLTDEAPFKELFGYALLLAEDGSEMHKSAGNSIEFNEAADKMGVDVMRWLYCGQKPENNLLFGYHRADEVRRRLLIPLWNVYSFLATYARLDEWTPTWVNFDPAHPEGSTPESENPLDRWMLARLNQTVERVTEALDATDAFGATLAVEPLIDDLTNWYVRRSRRRFWRSEQDGDKQAAYATLYHVLVKLARLLAPFTPFVAEEIYQNLVGGQVEGARSSVHHTDWPLADGKAVDEALIEEMGLARQIASLGLSARGNAGIKVRQPLAAVLVHVENASRSPSEFGEAKLHESLIEIILDELNVKNLRFVTGATELVSYKLQPDNAKLGPRFGADFPKLRAALEGMDAAAVKAKVDAGESVVVKVGKEAHELAADEILVKSEPVEGLAVSAEKGLTVAVDAEITVALKAEGLARELVRRIQDMRKSADFNIEDRIATYYQTESELGKVFVEWGDYIKAETLSEVLEAGGAPAGAYTEELDIEGQKLTVGVERR
ncbi:MAG: isoleucine--tRNA ligase [Chloroflexi bacterium]|nr:class I tRNA ligase family protein [Chloroflexota bacterium]MQC27356.1 isoleucine--tRNA ligase [Chloroflexota bacterium]